ncbi:MAG: ATP-dependent helicase [Bacilli bacterium]
MNHPIQAQLNDKQWQAVITPKPYVRIIAGAGSGKTRVLTFRIAYLINDLHVYPEQILAITFTNKVAKEMLQRASALVPNLGSRLKIMTYHSFAARLLRREIHHLGYPKNFTILDDDDQEKLVKNIAEEKGFRRGDEIVKQALRYIAEQKSQGIPPGDIRIEYERFPTEKLCLSFYETYELKMRAMANLDFDDLLIKAIQVLEQFPEVKARWQSYHRHILVDEFQDTNDVQYHLLQLLLHPQAHLYVVGDPDQTIYSWRGANPKIILDLTTSFPVETIILNQNYRSTKPILDLANQLIDHNQHRVKKDLFTEITEGQAVQYFRYFDREEEAHAVVASIRRLISQGQEPKHIVILYRANYLTLPFEKALTREQIPFRIFGGMRFYQRQEIKDAIAYFKLIENPKDDLAFERIINVPRRGIGEVTFQQLKTIAMQRQLSLYEASAGLSMFAVVPTKLKAQLQPMVDVIETYKIRLQTEGINLRQEVEQYLRALGYIKSLESHEEEERLENIYTLLDDLEDYLERNPEATFTSYLENISLMSSQDEIVEDNFVSLMTVHTAKGLEFAHVFVIGLNEGVFPSLRTLDDHAFLGLEEERRLCYVAFTRAKSTLTLSCASDFSFVIGGNLIPSRFFKEAGLIFKGSYQQERTPTGQTASFIPTQSSRLGVLHAAGAVSEPTTNPQRKTTWEVGDACVHETFGKGVVTQILSTDIIEIQFEQPPLRKKLIAQHPKLNKVK